VLKRFGPAGRGLLSFPIEGYTLTLDLPVSDSGLFPFLDRLDAIVLEHGGRVYLAKDARLKPATFRQMYPRLDQWRAVKKQVDPDNRFDSDLARRLKM
jgi:decaprenylphospho-beta-D-ribofuranose 2-oxidase